MRDLDVIAEENFMALFRDFFDSEKDAAKQHNPENYTLDRMKPLLELADNPQDKLKIVHVAGTKGKGSTCHFISSLIQAAGHQVGLFTSPHLDTVRERFQVNNELVTYEQLTQTAEKLLPGIRQLPEKPSLFEIFTVMAMQLFVDSHLEYAVLETGIGGRLDATNIVKNPLCTAITSVSFDHLALLGHTIQAIAGEKAGIIKEGIPLVLGKQPFADAETVIRRRAAELHAPVLTPCTSNETQRFTLPDKTPDFIWENFGTALQVVVQVLKLQPNPQNFHFPLLRARCECLRKSPLLISDAAHNGDSMERLVHALPTLYPEVDFTVILGVVAGKDVDGIVAALAKLPNARFILTNPHTGKGSALSELQLAAKQYGLKVISVCPELKEIKQIPSGEPLLFTGSFFTALIAEEIFSTRK